MMALVPPIRTFLVLLLLNSVYAFKVSPVARFQPVQRESKRVKRRLDRSARWSSNSSGENNSQDTKQENGDNKAMQFLKKMGKVGGAANRDFRYAIGVDEGPAGKSSGGRSGGGLKKAKAAFKSCVDTGVIDDMSEVFPTTCSGTRWSGFT